MKRFRFLSLMLVLALVLVAGTSYAVDRDERLNAANLAYSKLHSVQYISLTSTTKALTPTDTTSTNTFSVGYFPVTVPLPCKMVITGASTTPLIHTKPYSTSTTAGVDVPTATCAYLPWDSNIQITKTFVGRPNLSLRSSAAATITVELWVQP